MNAVEGVKALTGFDTLEAMGMRDFIAEEQDERDSLQIWIDTCCDVGSDYFERSAELAESYNQFLSEISKDSPSVSTASVTRALKSKGFRSGHKRIKHINTRSHHRCILGLRLRHETEMSQVIPFKTQALVQKKGLIQ